MHTHTPTHTCTHTHTHTYTHAPSSCRGVSHSSSVVHTWCHRAGLESTAWSALSSHTDTLSPLLEDMEHSRYGDRDECNDAFHKTAVSTHIPTHRHIHHTGEGVH